jgi:hypothetical protein
MKNNSELDEILNSNHHAFLLQTLNREQKFLEIKNEIEDFYNKNKNRKVSKLFFKFKSLGCR